MAASPKFISFLFLLTLFFSMQIHARDSQFFSKVTNVNNNNNAKETTVVPNKEETTTKQNQEPTFIPETREGYGLYGHESGQIPPTTTTLTSVNAAPYTTTPTNLPYQNEFEDEESLNKYLSTNDNYNNNNKNYYSNNNVGNNKKNYYNTNFADNKNSYEANQYGMSDTRLTDRGYNTMANRNNYNGANRYSEKQGMSDTRYLENGKYYYDPKREKHHPNQYGNSRDVGSRNWYGNKGYYSNNGNSFENNNSMEGYGNAGEFQEEQDEFWP